MMPVLVSEIGRTTSVPALEKEKERDTERERERRGTV